MMTLQQALQWLPSARLVGGGTLRFQRVHTDTRSLQPGDLFVALQGERFDAQRRDVNKLISRLFEIPQDQTAEEKEAKRLAKEAKDLALEELVSEIKKRVSAVILLMDPNYKGSARLAESLQKAGIAYEEASELPAAVTSAFTKTKTGTVLFSPAFASFGMFKNEYERNDQFLEIVRQMEDAA